jgi:hypothetical protein
MVCYRKYLRVVVQHMHKWKEKQCVHTIIIVQQFLAIMSILEVSSQRENAKHI